LMLHGKCVGARRQVLDGYARSYSAAVSLSVRCSILAPRADPVHGSHSSATRTATVGRCKRSSTASAAQSVRSSISAGTRSSTQKVIWAAEYEGRGVPLPAIAS
jgi:hypothetical protein